MATKTEDFHEGPVHYSFPSHGYVLTLCPFGHLISASKLGRDWGGSYLEAEVSGEPRRVRCYGALAKS